MEILKTSKIKEYRDSEKERIGGICPLFNTKLDTNYATRACLDHSHDIPRQGVDNPSCGRVRGVLSNSANLLLGRLEKAWNKYGSRQTNITFSQFLRNCADYLDQDFSNNPVHPREIEMWKKRLKRWRVAVLLEKLRKEGISTTYVKLKQDAIDLYLEKVIIPMYFNRRK